VKDLFVVVEVVIDGNKVTRKSLLNENDGNESKERGFGVVEMFTNGLFSVEFGEFGLLEVDGRKLSGERLDNL